MSGADLPKSVLVVCNMNQIRSPMAEFLMRDLLGDKVFVQSAGLYTGDEDGFMQAIMAERNIDVSSHVPESLDELEDSFVDLVSHINRTGKRRMRGFFPRSGCATRTLGNRKSINYPGQS